MHIKPCQRQLNRNRETSPVHSVDDFPVKTWKWYRPTNDKNFQMTVAANIDDDAALHSLHNMCSLTCCPKAR